MANVEFEHIVKKFGDITAVNDFHVTINDGEFVSFLGPSGCGKTTSLRMIAGFIDPTGGIIRIGDNVVSDPQHHIMLPPEKRNIGMVFQSYAVWPHMNVFNNVAYPLKLQKIRKTTIKERVEKALNMVHLGDLGERMPYQLSGGQQQRVALARSLVMEPQVLLLDEPLSNLDAKLREEMRFELKDLQDRINATVIYVTHDQAEAMAMSDRIVVMNKGVVQQVGAPTEIYRTPANSFVAGFIGLTNFIPCEIKGKNTVEISDGASRYSVDANVDSKIKGKNAILSVRPEDIQLASPTEDFIPGIIERMTYLGNSLDYRIRVGELDLRVISPPHKIFAEDEKVGIKIREAIVFEA